MNEEKKINPKERYACCPVCGRIIAEGENAKSLIVRCTKCHTRIKIDICEDMVTTNIIHKVIEND